MKRFAAAVVAVVALSSPAFAQTGKSAKTTECKETNLVQCVDFTGAGITGEVTKPEIDVVPIPTRPGFESLIKIRGSFNVELGKSVENL